MIGTTTEEVCPYDDPVVTAPSKEEWNYITHNNKEVLVCPNCFEIEKEKIK
jgi:hypothetical protein